MTVNRTPAAVPVANRAVAHPEWAMVLGGGPNVWEEVLAWEAVYGRQWDGLVIAANDVGAHWPRELDHWCSLHPNKFPKWKDLRIMYGNPMDGITTWGMSRHNRITDRQLPNAWGGGSSGMMAVQVAWKLGCTRAVLCGIPMEPTAHFTESREGFGAQWRSAIGHWRAWLTCRHRMDGWVKSMSGKTRDLFGDPTMEWLRAGGPLGSPVHGVSPD